MSEPLTQPDNRLVESSTTDSSKPLAPEERDQMRKEITSEIPSLSAAGDLLANLRQWIPRLLDERDAMERCINASKAGAENMGKAMTAGMENEDRLEAENTDLRARCKELKCALIEALIPLEVIAAQNTAKQYKEMTAGLMAAISEAIARGRATILARGSPR